MITLVLMLLLVGAAYGTGVYAAQKAIENKSIRLVAAVILSEAGGEGYDGMYAVAAVIKNRSQYRKQSPEVVVISPRQFSGYTLFMAYGGSEEKFIQMCKDKWPEQWPIALSLSTAIHKDEYFTNKVGRATIFCTLHSAQNERWRNNKKTRFVCSIKNHNFYEEL